MNHHALKCSCNNTFVPICSAFDHLGRIWHIIVSYFPKLWAFIEHFITQTYIIFRSIDLLGNNFDTGLSLTAKHAPELDTTTFRDSQQDSNNVSACCSSKLIRTQMLTLKVSRTYTSGEISRSIWVYSRCA